MDKFDRKIQHDFLMSLYEAYPHSMTMNDYCAFLERFENQDNITANLLYLKEHGLITATIIELLNGLFSITPENIKITSKGIDFVRDDGGLSSILNVQTIKFHREAVVVLEDLFALSSMTNEEKVKAKSTLGELSLEALKAVVQTATTAGLAALTK
ncbi:hypothetical protein WCT90_20150 [Pectobacterium carotovorum]|uniref:hypothetical protein n=1 Tax=Pectobacterium carotovorum TaxID=554 RepID=UPI00301A6275